MRDHIEGENQTQQLRPVEPVPERADAVRGHPRSSSYVRESHGVHRRRDLGDGLDAALHAWQLLMPNHGSFTGLTSAEVRKWWLPPIPKGTPVFIALGLDDPRPMRRGVRTSRHTRPIAYDDLEGLRCASIPETLMACARVLGLIDLVVMIDCALHLEQCTVKEIQAVIQPRRPGAKALARGLAHADGGSESAYETLLRLLHVLCGIEVESQYVVRDEDGNKVARADLRILGTAALPEFDGDEHEKARRRVKDRRRDRAIERADHVRRGYTAGDVLHRSISVLRDAERSLGLPHDPARVRPGLDELRKSLFSPSGQADFLSRTTPRLPERARPGRPA